MTSTDFCGGSRPLKAGSERVDPGDMPDARRCRTCGAEIQASARICPRCHLPQSRLSFIPPVWLVPVSIALFLVVLAGMLALLSGGSMFLPGADFEEHADEILVADSTFDFSDETGRSSIAAVGTLKNTGSIDWKDLRFEVRYFDSKGHLIDTESLKEPSLVLRAGGEAPFRVEGTAVRPPEQYASHQVIVRDADDLAGWP